MKRPLPTCLSAFSRGDARTLIALDTRSTVTRPWGTVATRKKRATREIATEPASELASDLSLNAWLAANEEPASLEEVVRSLRRAAYMMKDLADANRGPFLIAAAESIDALWLLVRRHASDSEPNPALARKTVASLDQTLRPYLETRLRAERWFMRPLPARVGIDRHDRLKELLRVAREVALAKARRPGLVARVMVSTFVAVNVLPNASALRSKAEALLARKVADWRMRRSKALDGEQLCVETLVAFRVQRGVAHNWMKPLV